MLAQEMFVLDALGSGSGVRIDLKGQERHLRDFLQNDGMVHRLRGILAPGERAVARANHTGNMHGLDVPAMERFDNHLAGVLLIVLVDLLLRQRACAGIGAVEVIGVRGAEGTGYRGRPAPRPRRAVLCVWTTPPDAPGNAL